MFLLRQWQLLEAVVIPLVLAHPPVGRTLVWNLGPLEDAVAFVLAYMHWRPGGTAEELAVFHTGPAPPRQPVQWSLCELRGVPKNPWLEPVPGRRSRWSPVTEVMERVLLGPPPGPVDLVIGSAADLSGWSDPGRTAPHRSVRSGGHLLVSGGAGAGLAGGARAGLAGGARAGLAGGDPGAPGAPGASGTFTGWEPAEPGGRVLRRSEPATPVPPAVEWDVPTVTLARVHERALMVESCTNLARALAHRFAQRGERVDDLEQVAHLALVKAADRYEPQGDRPFPPYATACIVGELKRHFRDKMWAVRVPRSVQETYMAVRSARDDLGQNLGRSPTIAEVAAYLRTSEEDVLSAMDAASNCWGTSLDAVVEEGSDPSSAIPVTDSRLELTIDRETLKHSVSDLSPTEQLVVRRVFFDEKTQRQVAEELGVSQMQVSRLVHRTLEKMRTSFQPA